MFHDTITVHGLELYAYHGVNPEEKENGQRFLLDFDMTVDVSDAAATDDLSKTVSYSAAVKTARAAFLAETYDLIETASEKVADALLAAYPLIESVAVTVKKPDAPMSATFDYVAVTVRRRRKRKAVLSLGSNMGDRDAFLTAALSSIDALPATHVLRTSPRYVTAPWGGVEQEDFLNLCAEIETSLSPAGLLSCLQRLERDAHRTRTVHWGPRTLDIDIILYEGVTCESERLTLPHPRFLQRAFVLRPLSDLYPDKTALGVDFADALLSTADQKTEKAV